MEHLAPDELQKMQENARLRVREMQRRSRFAAQDMEQRLRRPPPPAPEGDEAPPRENADPPPGPKPGETAGEPPSAPPAPPAEEAAGARAAPSLRQRLESLDGERGLISLLLLLLSQEQASGELLLALLYLL